MRHGSAPPAAPVNWHRRWTAGTVATLLAGLLVGFALPATPAAAACPDSQSSLSAALSMARTCGKRIEVVGDRTDSSQLFALASGKISYELSATPQRVRGSDGSWRNVDPALHTNPDGTLSPLAAAVDLTVSGGGTGALVRVGHADHSVALSWPAALPKPTMSGASAGFANVLPGVDLRVTASVIGFSEVLVVKNAAAAKNPALAALKFGLITAGLTVSADATTGALSATDPRGAVVFSSGTPRMWDSTGTVAGPSARSTVGELSARQTPLATSVVGGVVVLRPPATFLADPALVFPVMIDPGFTYTADSAHGMTWTQVYATFPTTSYWMDTDSEGLKVGYAQDSGYRNRSFWTMPLPATLQGATVSSATFAVNERYAWTCTLEPVDLYQTGAISSSTTWNNQPTSWPSSDLIGEQKTGYGYNSSCPGREISWDTTGSVQAKVNANATSMTFGMRTPNESLTNPSDWHKYIANSAKLTIVYDHPPTTPTPDQMVVGTSGQISCASFSGSPLHVNTTNGLTLSATLTDPDGGAGDLVKANWVVTGLAGPQYAPSPDAPSASGSIHTATIPAAAFVAGSTVTWQVQGIDSSTNTAGALGPPCAVVVDNSAPATPVLASTDLALRVGLGIVGAAKPTAIVGVPATVTVTPDPAGGGGIVGYLYGVAADVTAQPTIYVPADASGAATLSVVPVQPSSFDEISVVSVRIDGTASAPTTAKFRTNSATGTSHAAHDATGDGRGDVTTLLDMGGGKSALWRFDGTGAASAVTTPVAVQGTAGIYTTATTRVVEGDFDGDGLADIATLTQPGSDVIVSVQRSNANALLSTQVTTLTGWTLANLKVVAGDFTGDGRDDLGFMYKIDATTWEMRIMVATSVPGTVSFAAPVNWHTNSGSDWTTINFVAGDFNGDGKADIIEFKSEGAAQVRMYEHNSTGTAFPSGTGMWDSGAGNMVWANAKAFGGDFNGDGKTDVGIAYQYDSSCGVKTSVDYATGAGVSGTLTQMGDFGPATWCLSAMEPIATDVTGDGKADWAIVYHCCGTYQTKVYVEASTATGVTGPVLAFEGGLGPMGTGSLLVDTTATVKYELVNVNSGKCVGTPGGSMTDTTQLAQRPCAGTLDQLYTINRIGPGFEWVHMAHAAGKCIDWWSNTDNQPIWLYTCNTVGGTGAAEYMQFDYLGGPTSAPVVRITNHSSGKCMEIAGASTSDGALVRTATCTGATNQQYRLQPMPGGGTAPVAWYTMSDNGGGLLSDSSGRGSAASLAGSASVGSGVATFNGSTGYAATSGPILRTDGSFSVTAWARVTALGRYSTVLSQAATTSGGLDVSVDGNNHWTFDLYSADTTSPSVYSAVATAAVTAGTWYHVAATYTASTGLMSLYVNGTLVASQTHLGAYNSTGPLSIGRGQFSGSLNNYWPGGIDDVRAFDTALSASDITTIYNTRA